MSDDGKKESGAAGRSRRAREQEEAWERGSDPELDDLERRLFGELGDPPINAAGNVAWAQGAAAIMARLTLADDAMPRAVRYKLANEYLKSIGLTTAKAITDERLRNAVRNAGPEKVEAARKRVRELDRAPKDNGLDDLDQPPRRDPGRAGGRAGGASPPPTAPAGVPPGDNGRDPS